MNGFSTLLLLLCLTSFPMAAQTKVLLEKNRVPVIVPEIVAGDHKGGIAFPTACDEQGRSYIKVFGRGPGMVGPLLRLSSKGFVEAEFDTSGELTNLYAVRPDGGVIMMRLDGAIKVLDNFAPDGMRESSIRLEKPPVPFFPSQLAVFQSREVLVAGLQYHPGYKASTAIYNPTGQLVKQFVLDGDVEIERSILLDDSKDPLFQRQNQAVGESVAISGRDGLVYFMRATSPATVYAISAAGDVVRKIVVRPPNGSGLPLFGVRVVKSKLVVQFRPSCNKATDSCRTTTYAVVDAATGQRLADYEADKELAGPIACFASDPDRFFIFSDWHGLEIVEAQAK